MKVKELIGKVRRIHYKRWVYTIVFTFLGLRLVSVVTLRFIPVPVTPLMVIRSVEQLKDKERDFRWEKDWVSLDHISKNAVKAVLASEDQAFFDHNGFDFVAIEKAIAHNKVSTKKIGASTISQQTAKNVFLWQGRNWVRKGLEAYFTVLIELVWPKERILEAYLNVIEFGDGIYGIEAASKHYFHKSASELNKKEAAMLAAVLPNPLKYKVNAPSDYLSKRCRRIMNQMNTIDYIQSQAQYTLAK